MGESRIRIHLKLFIMKSLPNQRSIISGTDHSVKLLVYVLCPLYAEIVPLRPSSI